MSETTATSFSYGGQAVIEGVMMRGAQKAAIAVRDPNGEIQVREVPLNATLYRGRIARTPFLRGLIGLWDALGLGTRALLWSADVALIEGAFYRVDYQGRVAWVQHAPAFMSVTGDLKSVPALTPARLNEVTLPVGGQSNVRLELKGEKTVKFYAAPDLKAEVVAKVTGGSYPITGFLPSEKGEDVFTGVAAGGMVAVSLAFGIGLFFILPTAAASGAGKLVGAQNSTFVNILEEVIKMGLFLGYLVLIGQLEDVKRLFRYHGAEHKTINAYEAGAELTPKVVQGFPIEHPRCGTAFLLNVIIISVIVNSLVGRFDNNLFLLIPARVLTIPVVAGIAYEWLRLTAKYANNPLVRVLIKPNLLLQRMTTREPDDEMVGVAIEALERVLAAEGLDKKALVP
jgi:uncharacterized protein YqhQ